MIALVVAGGAEAAARLAEDDLPEAVRWYDAASQRKIDQMDRRGPTDVVFAGTSMAWQGLDPATFTRIDRDGRSAYNAGLAGGIPGVMEPWLVDEVAPRLEPELVDLGAVHAGSGARPTARRTSPPTRMRRRSPTGVMAELDRRAGSRLGPRPAAGRRSAIPRRGGARATTTRSSPPPTRCSARWASDGSSTCVPDRQRAQLAATRLQDWEPSRGDLATIRRTVRELTDQGISVVLTPMPTPPRFVELHPDGAGTSWPSSEALAELADGPRGPADRRGGRLRRR